jgi:hypothetical protein
MIFLVSFIIAPSFLPLCTDSIIPEERNQISEIKKSDIFPKNIGFFLSVKSEQTCKPGSVVDSHLSWSVVANSIMRLFIEERRAASLPSFVLLQVGFTEPPALP